MRDQSRSAGTRLGEAAERLADIAGTLQERLGESAREAGEQLGAGVAAAGEALVQSLMARLFEG